MDTLRRNVGKLLALTGIFTFLLVNVAFAAPAGKVTITGGKEIQTGQEASVTVTLSGDENFSETDMFVTYDTELLQFVSGDADEVNGGRIRLRGTYPQGSQQQTWNIQFRALKAGTAEINAEEVWLQGADEEFDIQIEDTEFTIGQGAETPATAVPQDGSQATGAPADGAAPTAATPSLEEQILNDGTMSALVGNEKWIVQETFPDEILPKHFGASTQFYKGVEVKAAKLNNAPYYLVYVKSEDGTRDKFCEYNSESKKFRDIVQLPLDDNRVIYMFQPGAIPEGFQHTVLTVGNSQYDAWQVSGGDQPSYAADPSQFYILCGFNENGASGWFTYDPLQNSLQRYAEFHSAAEAETSTQTPAGITDTKLKSEYENLKSRFEFLVKCIKYVSVAVIALLLLLLIVNLSERGGEKEEKKAGKEEKKKRKEEKKANKRSRDPQGKDKQEKPAASKKTSDAKTGRSAEKEELPEDAGYEAGEDLEEDFLDDYNMDDKAPKTEEEQEAIGVLKPVTDSRLNEKGASAKDEKPVEEKKPAAEEIPARDEKPAAKKKPAAEETPAGDEKPVEEKKPAAKPFSMTQSIEELSRQIQNAMDSKGTDKGTDDDLDDLTFIDLDD